MVTFIVLEFIKYFFLLLALNMTMGDSLLNFNPCGINPCGIKSELIYRKKHGQLKNN